ncbi:MAG: hypothetical protein IPM25_04855 [Chloracidobacterium sp.]|nr:hypothetical protein [Chloracidobacterium sp.]
MSNSFDRSAFGFRGIAGCISIAMAFVAWVEPTPAQVKSESFGFARVVDEAGWKVPEISSGNLKEKKVQSHDGVNFTENRYEPRVRTELTALTYYMDEKRDLYQSTKHLELQFFSTLEVAGKIFAYRTDSLQFGISAIAGRMYFGERIQFTFIDTDGDGKYETREYGDFLSVPAWVKEISKKE